MGYDDKQLRSLFDLEKKFEEIGKKALNDKRYFPGFFTFLAQKKE